MRAYVTIACAVVCLGMAALSPVRAQSSAETLFIEAQKALARGDDAGAESLLVAALAKDRTFVSAHWQLSQIYESRGRLEDARDALVRGLEIDPKASWARERLAQIEDRLAASAQAEARRRKQLEETKKIARIERLAGEAKRALDGSGPDRSDAARAALERLIEEDPGNAWAAKQLRELERPSPPPSEPAPDTVVRIVRVPVVDTAAAAAPPAAAASAQPRRAEGSSIAGVAIAALVAALAAAATTALVIGARRRASQRAYPLQGTTSLVPALDVVTLLCGNRSTGVLVIAADRAAGEIYFEKGEIIHARCAGLAGKKAFQKLMEPASSRFFFENHLPTVRRTISEPLSLLLLSMKPRDDAPVAPKKPAAERQSTKIGR